MSIGETLTAARLAAGLTTADVAEKTRIRRTLVEAIEADDYRLCGGDIYARGHIGTIARTVGTDPAPLLADFDRSHPRDTAPRATEVFESETTKTRERRVGPNWSAAMAAALVVVVLLAGWQLSRGGGNESGDDGHRADVEHRRLSCRLDARHGQLARPLGLALGRRPSRARPTSRSCRPPRA